MNFFCLCLIRKKRIEKKETRYIFFSLSIVKDEKKKYISKRFEIPNF